MRKRELKDFEDRQLKGEVNSVDFESILQIAVLCVSKSSKGRPTIEVVVEEMEKVLKNTLSDKVCKKYTYNIVKHTLEKFILTCLSVLESRGAKCITCIKEITFSWSCHSCLKLNIKISEILNA